jgi:PAS domain S-box-containing protein
MKAEDDILIVSDEIPNLKLLTGLLEREGYAVRPAELPQAAIDSALAKPPLLILLDVKVAEMSGFEVCRLLKQDERTRDIPIIFISSLHDAEDRVRGFDAGGVDFISKPFQEREVLARVRNHTQLRRLQLDLERLVDQRTFELRESKERYELAVAGSAAGLWDWDIASDKIYYSDRLQELLGYESDEFSNSLDEFWDRLHPDDTETVRQSLDRHLQSREVFDVDYRLQKKSGEYRWFHARGQALWDYDGEPTRMSGSISDITDRKVAEEELAKSEVRFRELMEQSPMATVIHSPDGKIIKYNSAWSLMWDVTGEEAAQFLADYNVLTDQQMIDLGWAPLIEEAFAGKVVILPAVEYSSTQILDEIGLDHIVGKTAWIQSHLSPVKDENGEVVFVVNTVVDITKIKLAEEELVKSEERFRMLMEQSPMAMEILSPDGRILQVNSAWKKLWNTTDEEAAATLEKYNMLTDPQNVDLGVAELTKKAFEGEPVTLPPIQYSAQRTTEDFDLPEMQVRSPWIRSHLYPVKDQEGNVEFVVNTYQDITDIKRAEAETRQHQDAIARLNRATSMGQLTGSIAHELNQPLTGILSNAQAAEMMINSGQWDNEELAEIMADIVADTKRGGDVIHSLRELYREQKGEYKPVDINAVVEETRNLLHSEYIAQHIVVTTETAPSTPSVDGNRIQIQQILVNLIMNGVQAMAETPRENRCMRIVTDSNATEVTVSVEDCGHGIDPEKIDRIFEPLATWRPGGTGMGLAISNSIVEAHGGRMWAENKPDGGVIVCFAIPKPNEDEKK